jgi:hypothetical protein
VVICSTKVLRLFIICNITHEVSQSIDHRTPTRAAVVSCRVYLNFGLNHLSDTRCGFTHALDFNHCLWANRAIRTIWDRWGTLRQSFYTQTRQTTSDHHQFTSRAGGCGSVRSAATTTRVPILVSSRICSASMIATGASGCSGSGSGSGSGSDARRFALHILGLSNGFEVGT